MAYNFNKKKQDEDFQVGKSRKAGYYDKGSGPVAQLRKLKGMFCELRNFVKNWDFIPHKNGDN